MASAKIAGLLLLTLFSITMTARSEEAATDDKEWIRGFARKGAKENPLPKHLIKKIEEDYFKAINDPKTETKKPIVRQLLTVDTELTQEKLRALKGPTRIMTPPGGGTIDMADYVTPLKGAFHLKISLEDEHHHAQALSKVYFVSNSKKHEIDHEAYGAGCGKYMDVTSYFKKQMTRKGFDLYTAEQRYVNVLRGTFILINYTPEALQLASVTFLDSRYTKWDCPQPEVL
jgi:hypothetical protein